MGVNVVGVNNNDDILNTITSQGTEVVFISRMNTNYIEEVRVFMDRGPNKDAMQSPYSASRYSVPTCSSSR